MKEEALGHTSTARLRDWMGWKDWVFTDPERPYQGGELARTKGDTGLAAETEKLTGSKGYLILLYPLNQMHAGSK
jgi:hypothetical protein